MFAHAFCKYAWQARFENLMLIIFFVNLMLIKLL